jgi:hypothetical protein
MKIKSYSRLKKTGRFPAAIELIIFIVFRILTYLKYKDISCFPAAKIFSANGQKHPVKAGGYTK